MNKVLVSAEWHFFTSQGPVDGMGGTAKSLAAKVSLQKVYNNQIQTTHELQQQRTQHYFLLCPRKTNPHL
jgi:hypothetical protein